MTCLSQYNIKASYKAIYSSASLLNLLSLGMAFGYPTTLIPALLKEDGDDVKTDRNVASWIASMTGSAGIFAVIIVGPLMHALGRKKTHLITTSLVLIGWIITAVAHSLPVLILGRALHGLGHGFIYFSSITIGEMSCPTIRGILLNSKLISVAVGIMSIHAAGYFLHWRTAALAGTVPTTLAIGIGIFWPESPHWLVSKGRFDEAKTVFFSLHGRSKESENEINKLVDSQRTRRVTERSVREFMKKMRSRALWRPVALLCCAVVIPEAGGRHFFPAYSLQLVEQITGTKTKGFLYTMVLDSISVVFAAVSTVTIKRFSRRFLLIRCGVAASLTLLLFCLSMFLRRYYVTDVLLWLSLALMAIYFTIVYGATFGVCYVLMGELFPLEYRAVGAVLNGFLSCIILTAFIKSATVLQDYVNVDGMFLIYSVCMLFALTYMYYDLPETKNRTLLDVELYFRGKSPKIQPVVCKGDDEARVELTSQTS